MTKTAAPKAPKAKKPAKITPHAENAGTGHLSHSYIAGATFGLKKVVYTAVDGLAMFEGDIVLGTVEQMERMKQSVEHPEPHVEAAVAIISATQFRWPDGIIPFEIDATMPDQQRARDAISHLAANTNLRFPAHTNQPNWIRFQGGAGCSSPVGMQGGAQAITLGLGCDWPRAVHEICHSAGLWHEQSRADRDSFVTIHWDNIQANQRSNFDQHITDGDDIGPYDYDSLMHYGRHDFAIDGTKDTITPIPNPDRSIGQRNGLSAGDIIALNALYPRKATLGETSSNGPSLAMRNGQILMAFTDASNLRLNFMSSADGLHFAQKIAFNDISSNAPALTVFNGNYVVTWISVGNNKINVMQSTDGVQWGNKVTLSDTSLSSPALAVFGNQLLIAWRGMDNKLNLMRSTNGIHFSDKITLGDITLSGPTLATFGARLLLGWRGVGNNRLNVIASANGTDFSNKVTLGETTVSRPQLLVRGNRILLTWQSVGDRLLNILSSANGAIWGNKFVSRENCIDGPALTTLGNNLVWGWTGTDAAHHLNTLLFNWT